MSSALSEYDIISDFRPFVPSKMRFFGNFLFLNELSSNLARNLKLDADSYFLPKSGFGNDFGENDTKTVILRRFLEIALPWQHQRSQVIKNYLKGCVIR